MTASKVILAFVGLTVCTVRLHGVGGMSIVERWQKEGVYENLKRIRTGYDEDSSSTAEATLRKNNLTDEELVEAIANKRTELTCGFAFSCLSHLEMIRESLGPGQQFTVEQRVTKELSFKAPARKILATLFNSDIVERTAEFWLFYVHMEILQECVDSAYYTKSTDGCPNFLQAHDAVDKLLRSFADGSCRQDNSFNSKYAGSVFNSDKAIVDGEEGDEFWRFPRRSVGTNKTLLNQLIEHNSRYNVRVGDVESFSYESLYLNHAIITSPRFLQENFGVQHDWRNVFGEIKSNYDLIRTEQRADTRSIRLGRFQNDFVNVLKAIMLRIACKYVLYVAESGVDSAFPVKSLFAIPYYNRRMSAAITEFMGFFHLEADEHFEAVANTIGSVVKNVFARDNAKRVVELIGKALSDVGAKFSFAVAFEPVTFENDQSTDPIVEHYNRFFSVQTKLSEGDLCFWLDVNVTRARLFTHYVQRLFRSIDLRVINSFIRFANDLETKSKFI